MVSTFGLIIFVIAKEVQGVTESVPTGATVAAGVQTIVLWALLWKLGTRTTLFYFLLTAVSVGMLSALAIYINVTSPFSVCDLPAFIFDESNY